MEKLLYFVFAVVFMIVVEMIRYRKELWEYYTIQFEDINSERWHKMITAFTVINILCSCLMTMILILTK